MSEIPTTLKKIPVHEIVRNPLNPRLKFTERKMEILKDSIRRVGVLVPITVFRRAKDGKYCLIDGERRWICAKDLNHKDISAVVIPDPGPEKNLLRMFSIHHLREQWSLIATALKLEQMMHMAGVEDNAELSALTGMSRVKINHCKRILSYPKKYQDMLLLADEDQQVKPDFFVELFPVLEKIASAMPNLYEKNPREYIIDSLIKKFRTGRILAAREFRNLRKLLEKVESKELPKETAETFISRLVEDPDTTIGEISRELDIEYLTEIDKTTRICNALTESLLRINAKVAKRSRTFLHSLRNLKEQIDRFLSSESL